MSTDKNTPLHRQIFDISYKCSKELLHSEAHELSIISKKVQKLEESAVELGFEFDELIRLLKLGKEHDSS